jgi:hypothetical protein
MAIELSKGHQPKIYLYSPANSSIANHQKGRVDVGIYSILKYISVQVAGHGCGYGPAGPFTEAKIGAAFAGYRRTLFPGDQLLKLLVSKRRSPYYRIGLYNITSLHFPAYSPPVYTYLLPFCPVFTQPISLFFVLYSAFRISRSMAFATIRAMKEASVRLPV